MLEKAKAYRKQNYDKNTSDFKLKIGDKVTLRNEAGHKLDPVYLGPYTVETIEDRYNIIIKYKKQKKQEVHKLKSTKKIKIKKRKSKKIYVEESSGRSFSSSLFSLSA